MTRLLQLTGVIVDLVYRVQRVPAAGEEAVVHGAALSAGGGFNAMVAACRAGLAVSYGGSLGTGPLADIVGQALVREGIDVLQSTKTALDQGCCTVLVDARGERTFIAMTGAESQLHAGDLPVPLPVDISWVLVSGYSLVYPGSRQAVIGQIDALPRSIRLIFDPGPLVDDIPPELLARALRRADWVSCNAVEAGSLTGEADPNQAAGRLASDRPSCGGAVVRTGAAGCVLARPGRLAQVIPGFAVATVDTNGAGDTHIGTFVASLVTGLQPEAACRRANAAAAMSTCQAGPATAPQPSELETLLSAQASSGL